MFFSFFSLTRIFVLTMQVSSKKKLLPKKLILLEDFLVKVIFLNKDKNFEGKNTCEKEIDFLDFYQSGKIKVCRDIKCVPGLSILVKPLLFE
eukprot:UN25611